MQTLLYLWVFGLTSYLTAAQSPLAVANGANGVVDDGSSSDVTTVLPNVFSPSLEPTLSPLLPTTLSRFELRKFNPNQVVGFQSGYGGGGGAGFRPFNQLYTGSALPFLRTSPRQVLAGHPLLILVENSTEEFDAFFCTQGLKCSEAQGDFSELGKVLGNSNYYTILVYSDANLEAYLPVNTTVRKLTLQKNLTPDLLTRLINGNVAYLVVRIAKQFN